jgi:hypothetical protein
MGSSEILTVFSSASCSSSSGGGGGTPGLSALQVGRNVTWDRGKKLSRF